MKIETESINRENQAALASVFHVLIFCILSLFYVFYISEIFAYEGYVANVDIYRLTLSSFFIYGFSYYVNKKQKELFAVIFFNIIIIMVVSPMSMLFACANKSALFYFESMVCCCIIVLMQQVLPTISITTVRFSAKKMAYILASISIMVLFYLLSVGGVSKFNLDFYKVYLHRDETMFLNSGLLGYIIPVVTKVILPISVLLFFITKRYLLTCLLVFLSLLFFGFTSHKSMIFYPLATLLTYKLINHKYKVLWMQLLCILALSGVGLLLFLNENDRVAIMTGSIALRRSFTVPAELNYAYFDFFQNNDYVLWSNSKINLGLGNYNYSMDLTHVIGFYWRGDPSLGANTGWLGSGYAHFGFWGMFIYSFVISLYVKLSSSIERMYKKNGITTAMLIVPSLVILTSSDLPTAFLTHGILAALIITLVCRDA